MVKDKETENENTARDDKDVPTSVTLEGIDDSETDGTDSPKSEIEKEPETESPKDDVVSEETTPAFNIKKENRFKSFLKTKKGKVVAVLTVLLVVIGSLLAVPVTRYTILGSFVKKNIHVMVVDSSTKKPVTQAEVYLGDISAKTDKKGQVTLQSVPVGEYDLKIVKGYYKVSQDRYTVPIIGEADEQRVSLQATGRQVTMSVKNKITGVVLAGATLKVGTTSTIADDKGMATIVLSADKAILDGVVSLDGYNDEAVKVVVSDQANANQYTLTPAGDVYYLSKQTGKLNVMKSKLDGANPSVVVEGTGNENDRNSTLLAARDWSYMALLAKRSADPKKTGQLHLIDAKTGGLKTIDEGEASFQLVGWSNHKFIYVVTRDNFQPWEGQTQRLKSYDADTGKLSVIDEITAEGTNQYDYAREEIVSPYILEGKIVYSKNVFRSSSMVTSKKSAIMSVNPDGSQKQRLKEFDEANYIQSRLYEPQEVYFRISKGSEAPVFYEYENNTLKSISNTDAKFNETEYPTYLVSPSGSKTFWSEPRDGKNTLLVGDKDGKDGKVLASQSEYRAYGWYGDKYVLLSKNDSELYIASADSASETLIKITNFHKPQLRYPGYGYGYGGL